MTTLLKKNMVNPKVVNTAKPAKGKLARCAHKKGRPVYGTGFKEYQDRMFGKNSLYNIRGGK